MLIDLPPNAATHTQKDEKVKQKFSNEASALAVTLFTEIQILCVL